METVVSWYEVVFAEGSVSEVKPPPPAFLSMLKPSSLLLLSSQDRVIEDELFAVSSVHSSGIFGDAAVVKLYGET